jgi:hypothetical protein
VQKFVRKERGQKVQGTIYNLFTKWKKSSISYNFPYRIKMHISLYYIKCHTKAFLIRQHNTIAQQQRYDFKRLGKPYMEQVVNGKEARFSNVHSLKLKTESQFSDNIFDLNE